MIAPDLLIRPSLDESIAALTAAHATDEERDVGEVLAHLTATHRGAADCDNPDEPCGLLRTWGTCPACVEPWPCREWGLAAALALLFVGRAADRAAAHADAAWDRGADAAESRPDTASGGRP